MAALSVLSKSLFKLAEVRCICRLFSTRASSLGPNDSSPGDSLLNGLDPAEVPYRLPSQTTKDSKLHKTSQAMGKRLSFERRSNTADQRSRTMEQVDKANRAKDLDKLQTRRWKQGDVYAPHDLTPAEMKKWKMRKKSSVDAFDILAINPVDQWKNYSIMSEYMTSMGRIRHSRDTGLRKVNQRRIAKAIKRAVGMGFMPSVHKHPEMLRRDRR
ncbi:hypothetical protein MMC24_003487 [Lignoscripta atroalba]|nr:hypothetical protein [Lignoscripta atroalba]